MEPLFVAAKIIEPPAKNDSLLLSVIMTNTKF